MRSGDRVELLEKYGTNGQKGDQGVVVGVEHYNGDEDALVDVELDKGYMITCYAYRLKVAESKATLKDAEDLLAMVEQLEDSKADLQRAKQAVEEEELAIGILENKINELKQKLNIA